MTQKDHRDETFLFMRDMLDLSNRILNDLARREAASTVDLDSALRHCRAVENDPDNLAGPAFSQAYKILSTVLTLALYTEHKANAASRLT